MPGPSWRAAGGYPFAHDPDIAAERATALWRPEVSPGTLILAPAPPGFGVLPPIDPAELGPILVDREGVDGRSLIIGEASGDLHIWLPHGEAVGRRGLMLPMDGGFELRLDIALRFFRRLGGHRVALLPRPLQLTSLQRTRLIQLLLAHDVQELGGGPRDIAAEVIGSLQAALPSIEWKDSAARRHANRLIHDSLTLVNGGYLRLLRGK